MAVQNKSYYVKSGVEKFNLRSKENLSTPLGTQDRKKWKRSTSIFKPV